MTRLRTYDQVKALKDLTSAEEKLLRECKTGEPTILGTSAPDKPTDATQIRAELLRYLILGGCKDYRPDEIGVRVFGAYITDTLDLSYGTAKGITELRWCQFSSRFNAFDTRLVRLDLSGSCLRDLIAEGARVAGNVFLDDGFFARGAVSLSGAEIGGQLACVGGRFENTGGIALNAQNARVAGNVDLTGMTATGAVRLAGAMIGGQLACDGARFDNKNGLAIGAQKTEVRGAFFLRNALIAEGKFDLASARVGDLVDDLSSWPERGPSGDARLNLNGFVYSRISGTQTDLALRLKWLSLGNGWQGEFHPQPYDQLARVMAEMGHARSRRKVLMRCEQLRNRATLGKLVGPLAGSYGAVLWLADWLHRMFLGYGYEPWRSLSALLFLVAIGWQFAFMAWQEGSFAPNSDVIVASAEWQSLARDAEVANPADVWSTKADPAGLFAAMPHRCWLVRTPPECLQGQGMDYEAFHSLAYAVDLVVPLVTLGQEATWAPSKDRGGWGFGLWWLRWVLTGAGWIVAAFAAAAVTGLIRRD